MGTSTAIFRVSSPDGSLEVAFGHTASEGIQTGVVVLVGRQVATVLLLSIDLLLLQ
ncbi:MAG: hypothetical protein LKF81_11105 [Prevotella sp.]|nr:hypothetical protein [Prevotella sp.]